MTFRQREGAGRHIRSAFGKVTLLPQAPDADVRLPSWCAMLGPFIDARITHTQCICSNICASRRRLLHKARAGRCWSGKKVAPARQLY
jgi:hypothetical protein